MIKPEKSRADLLADLSALQEEVASLKDAIRAYQTQSNGFALETLVTRISTDFINIDPSQVDDEIKKALEIIGNFVCVDRSYVFMFSDDSTTMANTHEWCRHGIEPQIQRLHQLKTDALPWFSHRIKSLKNVVIPHVSRLPAEAQAEKKEWQRENIQSLICVPMACRGKVIGFVGFDCVLYQNDWSGQVVTALRIVGDIFANLIDRKQTEEALRKSEETYRTLINHVDLGITLIGTDHRIIMANTAVCKMFNKAPEALIGRKCYNQFEKRPDICTHCPGETALKNGTYADIETNGIRDDGGRFPVKIRAFPLFYESGKPRGFIEVVTDITHQKQAERTLEESRQMLQIVLDNIPVRVFWKDRNSVFIGCNQLFARDAGLKSNQDIIGKTDDQLIWKDQADLYRADDARVIGSGTSKLNYEEPQTGPGGEHRWLRTNKVPMRNFEGAIIGVLGTYEDITVRKTIEQERESLLHALAAKNEEMESIIYITSHDLRSPLVNINGFGTELGNSFQKVRQFITDDGISKDALPEVKMLLDQDIPESLEYIRASADKMDALLRALLTLSRLGRVELKITAINMSQLLDEICRSMQYQITESKVRLVIKEVPDCMGDKGQISQVFTNLLDNAIKYLSPERKGRIRISGKVINNKCIYCVKDNGIGIVREHQDKVFEIFHRLAPLGTIQGEGIGLTAAQRILDRQNGRIWLESEIGKGTKFYIELPAAPIH
jgi:PAS domain S-box-containing protein